MKYPVLLMGIIMFAIFLNDPKTKKWWSDISLRYIPSTCKTLEDRLSKKIPDNWSIECTTTEHMLLTIKKSKLSLKSDAYKALANDLKLFSMLANPETLKYLNELKLFFETSSIQILAMTSGSELVKLRELKSKEDIAMHLKLTVKIKERSKKR